MIYILKWLNQTFIIIKIIFVIIMFSLAVLCICSNTLYVVNQNDNRFKKYVVVFVFLAWLV